MMGPPEQRVEQIAARLEAEIPGVRVEVALNPSPSGQHSLRLDREQALQVALWLRDDPELRFDYCSNVTGVDWPERAATEKDPGAPGCLEAVYHLFSIEKKHGPLVLRLRTGDRAEDVHLPSLTPVWRSAEFQEREIFDLFGIIFDGHPDLRRLLMWEGFTDHPMRRDYVPPDDDEDMAQALAIRGERR